MQIAVNFNTIQVKLNDNSLLERGERNNHEKMEQ